MIGNSVHMLVPETTSAEAFEHYVGGQVLVACRGEAWRDIKAWIIAPPRTVDMVSLPAVSEPFLAWSVSGEAEFQEREGHLPWITHRIKKGSFFLTSGGAPYDCRWKAVGPEPFQSMAVFIALPLLQRALEEIFGDDAPHARLRDLSAFHDSALNSLMERVHDELLRRHASAMFLQGIAHAIAIHLARNYTETVKESHSGSPSLPGFKVRQISNWMAEHMAEDFDLNQLAAQAGVSKFYFSRLFKNAMGVSPSRYLLTLRMDEAKRLLRETKRSVVDVALDVGFANPSHFARFFRRETGHSPSDYRQQR
ncbi:MAG: AraC family transcriptional regulator [Verrucomicrobiota bacterium]|jgi:AraC family transcriptional regulator